MNISERLRRARKRARLTLQDAASAVGVDRVTIGNWEAGRYSPKAEYLVDLARAYGVRVESFFAPKLNRVGVATRG